MAENMEGKTATELLAMGSKAYWLHKYTDAAAYLSRSSEMFVEEHKDDKHNSLGNVYLYYGKALLEIAREDGNPLGDGVPKEVGVEEELSDEEDEEGEEKEGDGEADGEVEVEKAAEEAETKEKEESKEKENEEGKEKEEGKEEADKPKEEDAKTDDTKEANISINGEAASSNVENGDDSIMETEEEGSAEDGAENAGVGGSGDKAEDEEPTDLQLAWEVLELAKVILERRGDSGKEDFADCLITLGEVSLESENFDSAITDIKSGLEIQKGIFTESKDMRKLAETHYKLGMALAAHNMMEEGIENYQKTLGILKECLKDLEAIETPGSSDLDEIKDIKNLIPELEDKIADLKSYKEEVSKSAEEEPAPVSSPEKKVNNITHLVKRKRKLVDVAEEAAESAAKKAAS